MFPVPMGELCHGHHGFIRNGLQSRVVGVYGPSLSRLCRSLHCRRKEEFDYVSDLDTAGGGSEATETFQRKFATPVREWGSEYWRLYAETVAGVADGKIKIQATRPTTILTGGILSYCWLARVDDSAAAPHDLYKRNQWEKGIH